MIASRPGRNCAQSGFFVPETRSEPIYHTKHMARTRRSQAPLTITSRPRRGHGSPRDRPGGGLAGALVAAVAVSRHQKTG